MTHTTETVSVSGDLALAHCLHRIEPIGTDCTAGQTWIRVTVGYRRIDGQWRVIHEHVSVPYDPRTEKVAYIVDPK
jgi:ketosteroid isomerase-like protein